MDFRLEQSQHSRFLPFWLKVRLTGLHFLFPPQTYGWFLLPHLKSLRDRNDNNSVFQIKWNVSEEKSADVEIAAVCPRRAETMSCPAPPQLELVKKSYSQTFKDIAKTFQFWSQGWDFGEIKFHFLTSSRALGACLKWRQGISVQRMREKHGGSVTGSLCSSGSLNTAQFRCGGV